MSEEFVIDVTAKFHDDTAKGASAVNREISKLSKGAAAYGKTMDTAKQKSRSLEEEQKRLTERLRGVQGRYAAAKAKADAYKNGLEALRNRLKSFNNAQKSIAKGTASIESRLRAAGRGVKTNSRNVGELTNTLSRLRQQQKSLNGSIEQTNGHVATDTSQFKQYSHQVSAAQKSISGFLNENNRLNTEMQGSTKTLNENTNAYTRATQEQLKLRQQANNYKAIKSGKHFQSVGKELNNIGDKLTLGITTPLTAAGTAAIKMAYDTETSFAKVSTIVDSAVLPYDKMKSQVMKESNATGVAITDFNEALYQSLSAGISSDKAVNFAKQMSKLARGGFTSTKSAVDVVTSALNAYGMSANQATAISDKLITTQNIGKTTVDELASEMGKVIPTAKAFHINIDSVCAAMADLTKNGIDTAESTTYFNSMLNDLGKSGTVTDKALRKATGKGFMQLMGSGKKVTDVLSILQTNAKKSGKSLADMFGTMEGGKAALTIMKDGGSEFNRISKQMQNSAGATESAFQKMNNTPLQKLKNDLNETKNELIQLGSEAMPYINKGINFVTKLITNFSQLRSEQKKAIGGGLLGAFVAGPTLKGIGGTLSAVGKIKELFSKHTVTTGVAEVGEDAAKAASKTGTLSKAISGIKNALGLVPLPLKLIGGAAIGVGVAIKKWHDYCVNDNLQKHFGDVQLSMEEVEDVVKRLTTNKWTMQIDTIVNNDKKINSIYQSIQDNINDLNKTSWKVHVGLDLTSDEKSNYKSSIDSFISNAKSYAENQHYTAKLAIDTIFMPNSAENKNTTAFTNSYYKGLDHDMTALGNNLAKLVNSAFSDGIITDAEMSKIDKAQAAIQKRTDQLNKARSEIKIGQLQQNALRGGLTADSFSKLISGLNSEMNTRNQSIQNATTNSLVAYQDEYDQKKISKQAYDAQVAKATHAANQQMATNQVSITGKAYDTLTTNFKDAYNGVDKNFSKGLTSSIADAVNLVKNGTIKLNSSQNGFGSALGKIKDSLKGSEIKGDSAENIRKFTAQLKPQTDKLLSYADDWLKVGKAVPQSYSKGVEKGLKAEIEAGDTSHYLEYVGMQMGKSPSYLKLIEQAKKHGEQLPDEFIKGAEMGSGKIFKDGVFKNATTAATLSADKLKSLMKKIGIQTGSSMEEGIKALQPDIQAEIASITNGITGKQTGSQIQSLFSNANINISSGLATAISKAKPGIQAELSGLLASCFSGVQLDNSAVSNLFSGLGTYLDQGVTQKISGLSPNIQEGLIEAVNSTNPVEAMNQLQAKFGASNPVLKGLSIDTDTAGNVAIVNLNGTIAHMNGITGNTTLKGPRLGKIMNATAVAVNSVKEAQNYLNAHPLVETMTVNKQVVYDNPQVKGKEGPLYDPNGMGLKAWIANHPQKATGGIVGTKSLTWLAEEGYPEMVIPFNPTRRQRALGLWQQTGEMLGVKPQYHAAGGLVGNNMVQFPRQRDPREIFASQTTITAAKPVTAVANSSGMNLGGVQIVVQGGDGDIVKVIAAHKQEIAEAVAEVVNTAMDSENVPMAQGE